MTDMTKQTEALREAQQPAQRQEPYGWHTEDHLTDRSATTYSKDVADRWKSKGWPVTPFYTSPPAQPSKPLTDELNQIEKDLSFHGLTLVKTATGYAVLKLGQITAHAIEAKLREKNGIKEHT